MTNDVYVHCFAGYIQSIEHGGTFAKGNAGAASVTPPAQETQRPCLPILSYGPTLREECERLMCTYSQTEPGFHGTIHCTVTAKGETCEKERKRSVSLNTGILSPSTVLPILVWMCFKRRGLTREKGDNEHDYGAI